MTDPELQQAHDHLTTVKAGKWTANDTILIKQCRTYLQQQRPTWGVTNCDQCYSKVLNLCAKYLRTIK